MPGRQPTLLHAHPAIGLLAAILFEIHLAVLALAEARHARELLADGLEEMQKCLPPVWQVHLRADPHVDIKILAERTERITHIRLPHVQAKPSRPRIARYSYPELALGATMIRMPKSVYALVGDEPLLQLEKLQAIISQFPSDVQRVDIDGER